MSLYILLIYNIYHLCCTCIDFLPLRLGWLLVCWLLPGTWSHLLFVGVREWSPWCSIVGATVTVHQFSCILHLYKEVYLLIFKCVSCWLHGCCGEWESLARKPVNHTNRLDVVCCHLVDRPQSVPQMSYNRTLQFSKTFILKRNAIFSLSSNAILPLENPLNVLNVICV